MELTTGILFVAGLVLLLAGAEALVRGAAGLAATLGLSPLVIGLTVVAFGTSSPELAVSLKAALSGQSELSYGNVVGSNIANVLLILGASAAITPLLVASQLIRLDVPIMIAVSCLCFVLGLDGRIGRLDGLLLALGIVVYTACAIYFGRRTEAAPEFDAEYGAARPPTPWRIVVQLALVGGGLAMLILGSRWLVQGAVALAETFGLSELVIGLTIVAVGTSLPEIATSLLAALRGERDIAVGGVVGSNIFNLLAVLGFTALLAPEGVTVSPTAIWQDSLLMVTTAVVCLPIFFTGLAIARWEGVLLLAYYAAYITYLVFSSLQHSWLPPLRVALLGFALPLTALTLLVLATGAIRRPARNARQAAAARRKQRGSRGRSR